jgi:hypothetical protein
MCLEIQIYKLQFKKCYMCLGLSLILVLLRGKDWIPSLIRALEIPENVWNLLALRGKLGAHWGSLYSQGN